MTDKHDAPKKAIAKKENQDNTNNKNSKEAFDQAELDIENDPETKLNADDDLDEGELARKEGHP